MPNEIKSTLIRESDGKVVAEFESEEEATNYLLKISDDKEKYLLKKKSGNYFDGYFSTIND